MIAVQIEATLLCISHYADQRKTSYRVTLERANLRLTQHPHAFVREHMAILFARNHETVPVSQEWKDFATLVSTLSLNASVLEARLMHKE